MAKIPTILEAGRADCKLIKTNNIYDDDQEKFLSDKIKEIDDNHTDLTNTVNSLINTVNNNESDIEAKLVQEKLRASNAENNLRETIDNITEVSGTATSANIVTIDTIPNTSSSNVQQALNELFKNATFAGIATPITNPGVQDCPVFYIATQAGIYPNFGSITVNANQIVVLCNINGSWKSYEIANNTKHHYSDSEQFELDSLINENICDIIDGDIIKGTALGNYGINAVTGELVPSETYKAFEYVLDNIDTDSIKYIKIYIGAWTNASLGTVFLDKSNNIIASYRGMTNGWKYIHIPYKCTKIKTFYFNTEREVRYVTVTPIEASQIKADLKETKIDLKNTKTDLNNSINVVRHNTNSEEFELDSIVNTNTCNIVEGDIIEGTNLGNYIVNTLTGKLNEGTPSHHAVEYGINEVTADKMRYIKIYQRPWSNPYNGTVFYDKNNNILAVYRARTIGWKYIHLPYKCTKIKTTYIDNISDVRYVTVKPISSSVLSENLNETKETLKNTINNVNELNNSLSTRSYNVSSKAMDLDNSILANTYKITDGNIIVGTELGAYEINGITGEVMTSVNKISYEYNLEVPVNKDIYIKIYVTAFSDSKIGTVFLDNNGKIILSYRPSSSGWKYFKIPYKCSKLRTTYSSSKIEEVRYVTAKPIDIISIRDNIQEQINNNKENTTWDIAYHSRNAIMCSYGIEPSYSILSRFCASRELGNNLRTKLVDIREYLGSTWYGEAYIAEKDGFIYAAGMYNMDGGEHGDNPIAIKLTKINKSDMSIVGSVDVTRCDKSLDAELTNEDGVITYNYSSYNPMIFFAENIIRVVYSTGQDNKDGSQIIHTVKYSDFDVELNLIKNDFCKIKTVDGTLLNMTWSSIQSAFGFSGRGHFTVGYCGYDSDSDGKKYLGIASGVGPFCVIATTDDFITYEIKKHIDNKYDCSFENSIVIDGDILFHAIRTQYITRTDTIRKRRVLWVQKLKLDTLEIIDEIAIPDCNTMSRLFKDSKGDIFLFCGANASSQLKYYVSADRDYYKLIKIDKYDLASSYMLCDTNGVQLTNLSLFMDSEIEDNFYMFINKGYIAKFTIPSYRVGKANDMIDKLMAL